MSYNEAISTEHELILMITLYLSVFVLAIKLPFYLDRLCDLHQVFFNSFCLTSACCVPIESLLNILIFSVVGFV